MTGRRTARGRVLIRLTSLAMVVVVIAAVAIAVSVLLPRAQHSGQVGPVTVPIVVPDEYRAILRKAVKQCPQVPIEILAAQIAAESSWDPTAVSPAGAQGIAQFMPATWRQYGVDGNRDGVRDVWDPRDAIPAAAALNCINRKLVKAVPGNRLANTLAAYNAGHGAVREHGGIPPYPETEQYVQRILENAKTIVLQ
ncbi:MAG: lytic transglycosylase domain-containing protein [Actinomycetales bacterium]